MAVKILYYFLCFFFVVIFMLVSQDPYLLDIDTNQNESPLIEFADVENHRINENGIELKAKAATVQRFENRDMFFDVDILMQEGNQSLRADNGTLQDDIVYLNGNVLYVNNDGNLRTESAEFHQKSGILKGTSKFMLKGDFVQAEGNSFNYDTKKEELEANGINAVIWTNRL